MSSVAHIGIDSFESLPDVQEVKPRIELRSLGLPDHLFKSSRLNVGINHRACVCLVGRDRSGGYTVGLSSAFSDKLIVEPNTGLRLTVELPAESETAAGLAIFVEIGAAIGLVWISRIDALEISANINFKPPYFNHGVPVSTLQTGSPFLDKFGNRKPTGFTYHELSATDLTRRYSRQSPLPVYGSILSGIEFEYSSSELDHNTLLELTEQLKRPVKLDGQNGQKCLILDHYLHCDQNQERIVMLQADQDTLLPNLPKAFCT